jgi:AcrR family transcriptional regulator
VAILWAALRLLASHGYTRMTLDQVAVAAGVSKSTIHLRWKTKADLVTAALESMRMVDAPALSGDAALTWW